MFAVRQLWPEYEATLLIDGSEYCRGQEPAFQLIRAVEEGEPVIITRSGRPVAQIVPPPASTRPVQFDGMRDRIKFLPGWDDPIDLDSFLEGDL